jgi:Rrf2 family protein
MKLSIETNYALSALTHLARHPAGSVVGVADLGRSTGVSPAFLSKILQRLTQAGFVRGYRGKRRGYGLAIPPESISARAVVEALNGPGLLQRCIFWSNECADANPCPLHDAWATIRQALWAQLDCVSIAQLAAGKRPRRQVNAHKTPAPTVSRRGT